jgi:glycosyltransferase involved in cell wall biosynthesis
MKNVVIRAPLLSKSGYGEHSRQLFRYLLGKPNINIETQVVPWGITPWDVSDSAFNGIGQEVVRRSASEENKKYDISFQVQLPNEWDASLANYNVGVTAAVETDKCNPTWTSVHCAKMDLVVVPSHHIKRTLTNSAFCNTAVEVVPECYFSDFNFLSVGVLTGMTPPTDRKNIFYMVKWFVEEFKDDEDVGLILKTNRGRETAIDRTLTKSIVSKILKEIGHRGSPKVYLLHGDMSRVDMNSLYRHPKVKTLLSTTRGEGFGLPLLEAAVAGLPVMATNWSAHTEFLDQGKWLKLDYELREVDPSKQDGQIFVAGVRWAEVEEKSFKRSLRKFRKSHQTPKKWASDLSNKLKKSHSEKAVFKKYDEVLQEVLA